MIIIIKGNSLLETWFPHATRSADRKEKGSIGLH